MIGFIVGYTLVMMLYTCIARAHGMEDPASVQPVHQEAPRGGHR